MPYPTVTTLLRMRMDKASEEKIDALIQANAVRFSGDTISVSDLSLVGGKVYQSPEQFILDRCTQQIPTIDHRSFEFQNLERFLGFLPRAQVAIHAVSHNDQSWDTMCRLAQIVAETFDGIINLNGRLRSYHPSPGLYEIPYDGQPDSEECYHCCTASYFGQLIKSGDHEAGLSYFDSTGSIFRSGMDHLSNVLRDLPPPSDG